MSVSHEDLASQLDEITQHVQHIPQMRRDIAETRAVVEAWDTAKNVGKFIKWCGGIAAAAAAIWLAIKALARGLLP